MNTDERKADELKADEEKKLYHYTSVKGFEGIINNNSIRMTKSDFLNDPSDCNLFITLVDKYIDSNKGIPEKIISKLKEEESRKEIIKKIYYEKGYDLIHCTKSLTRRLALSL
ncbi:MAG: hypothetical protein LUI39_04145 [Lachnospiraceae bacterium]|nr:hypothetical protein [Lachnospiraceae bacterium]